MKFMAEALIHDVHEMTFFIQQLNMCDISPKVHGRRIFLTLKDEKLDRIYHVLSTFESLKDKSNKNEFAFTLTNE